MRTGGNNYDSVTQTCPIFKPGYPAFRTVCSKGEIPLMKYGTLVFVEVYDLSREVEMPVT